MRTYRGPSIGSLLWIIVGVVVSRSHNYLAHVDTWRQVVSVVLAIVLWPLLLLGISLHIHG
jgi:hypothetical protein